MTPLGKLAREMKEKAEKADYRGPVIQHGSEVDWCNGNKVRVYGSALDQRLSNIAAHVASCTPARISALMDVVLRMADTLEKIKDPRKRDHKEPDDYTEKCCLMHMALEALAYAEERLVALEEKK